MSAVGVTDHGPCPGGRVARGLQDGFTTGGRCVEMNPGGRDDPVLLSQGRITPMPHYRSGHVEFVSLDASVVARNQYVTNIFAPEPALFLGLAPLSLHRAAW